MLVLLLWFAVRAWRLFENLLATLRALWWQRLERNRLLARALFITLALAHRGARRAVASLQLWLADLSPTSQQADSIAAEDAADEALKALEAMHNALELLHIEGRWSTEAGSLGASNSVSTR